MEKESIRKALKVSKPVLSSVDAEKVSDLFKKAVALHQQGELEQAIIGYQKVIIAAPRFAKAYNNLGVALKAKELFLSAIPAYEKSLALNPNDAGTLSNMGNALRAIGRLEDAEIAHRKALKADPEYLEATYNLGLVLKDMGKFQDALRCLDKVIIQKPEHAEAHWDRSLTYLQSGDLISGFKEYEWRWKLERNKPREFSVPLWQGDSLDGKTLLVHCEQGIGDSIQFFRYVSLLKRYNGKVVLECQKPLVNLLQNMNSCDQVVARGDKLPTFNLHVPLLSLPRIMKTTLTSIPNNVPYISSSHKYESVFKKLVTGPNNWLKVGLCWAGKPSQGNDRNRSCGIEPFLKILGIKNVIFYSLQVGPRAADIKKFGATGLIRDLSPNLKDFAHTAAAISNLDLIISVDTSVAHLTGAMNKQVWIPLCFTGDWRYLHRKTETTWYPSARLIQQKHFGNWETVFSEVNAELQNYKNLF
jgi:tetratricopeptide (TPR) repeat protein